MKSDWQINKQAVEYLENWQIFTCAGSLFYVIIGTKLVDITLRLLSDCAESMAEYRESALKWKIKENNGR